MPNKDVRHQLIKAPHTKLPYIKSIPYFNTGDIQYDSLFSQFTALEAIPNIDVSEATSMENMFFGCESLKNIPNLDTSNVQSMKSTFYHCKSLASIPLLNTSKVTDMSAMFEGCAKLTEIPPIDMSNVTTVDKMFNDCTSLQYIPQLNTEKVGSFYYMFGTNSLKEINGIDFSGATKDISNLFGNNSSLRSMTKFIVNGVLNYSISDRYGTQAIIYINYDSIKSVLTAASKTTNTNAKTLAFKQTMTDQDGELAALVAECATKGWTITGLTLN